MGLGLRWMNFCRIYYLRIKISFSMKPIHFWMLLLTIVIFFTVMWFIDTDPQYKPVFVVLGLCGIFLAFYDLDLGWQKELRRAEREEEKREAAFNSMSINIANKMYAEYGWEIPSGKEADVRRGCQIRAVRRAILDSDYKPFSIEILVDWIGVYLLYIRKSKESTFTDDLKEFLTLDEKRSHYLDAAKRWEDRLHRYWYGIDKEVLFELYPAARTMFTDEDLAAIGLVV